MKKRTLLLACLLAGFAVVASAKPYVILRDGRKIECSILRAKPDGTLVINGGERELPKGQYLKAVADRPADLDNALKAMRGGNWDAAIPVLEKVVKEYKFLDWDIQAQKLLAEAQLGKGDAAAAVRTYNALFQASEEEKNNAETQWAYRRAMLAAKQYAALGRELDKLAAEGSRLDAARAQNMRGKIELDQQNIDAALLEYLRTAILFEDLKGAEAGQVLGEACAEAAKILDQKRDSERAGAMRNKAQQYGYDPSKAR